MNLLRESHQFWYWTARILRQFLRARPGATLLVIGSTATARITRILAFFLPLKVILLAGNPGVPRYFPFISPDEKTAWIIGLTVGAFVAYGLTLLLQAVSERWSRDAGRDILQGANQISLHARQEDEAKSAFADFSGVAASVVFVGLAAVALYWLNPPLLGFLASAVLLIYLFSAWALRSEAIPPPRLKTWIGESTKAYLGIAGTLTFFGAFLVILAPFLLGHSGNILIAILSILLTQQILGNLSRMAKTAASLQTSRSRIDPLIYPSVQLTTPDERGVALTLRALFAKERRQTESVATLARATPLAGPVSVGWQDSTLAGAKTLHLIEHDRENRPIRHFQQQIFPPRQIDQLENEAFLFQNVPRKRLLAPHAFIAFEEADFRCQICAYGDGICVPAKEWNAVRDQLLRHIWSYRPNQALVRSYRGSRALLHQRLTEGLYQRLGIAIDTPEENALLARWRDELPQLRLLVQKQPRVLHNPDLNPGNVARDGDGHLIMAWGRWTLEPLGAAMFLSGVYPKGSELLESLHPLRPDFQKRHWEGDLQIAALCQKLEQQINREQYKAALQTIGDVLAQSQVTNNSDIEVRRIHVGGQPSGRSSVG